MPRMAAGKGLELEMFWRTHLDGWRRSPLNQREYCELHGLPLKRFGNWCAKLKHEEPASAGKLLWRRGGGLKHMSRASPASFYAYQACFRQFRHSSAFLNNPSSLVKASSIGWRLGAYGRRKTSPSDACCSSDTGHREHDTRESRQ